MNKTEKELLNLVQNEFPLTDRPFRELGRKLGISEENCIGILKNLSRNGTLRAIRAVINWNGIGYFTILIALKVQPQYIETVAEQLNKLDEITHNYQREGELNLWFTLIYETIGQKSALLERIRSMPGVLDIKEFPAEKIYKIGLRLDV